MLKVALFIRSLHIGGAEKQSILLAKALSGYFDTRLIVFYAEGELLNEAQQSLEKGRLVFLDGCGIAGKAWSLYNYLNKEKIDVLINYLPINNIIGAMTGKLSGVRVIFGGIRSSKPVHGLLRGLGQKFALNNLVDGIIANNSRALEQYAKSGYKTGNMHVIHNGIDDSVEKIIRPDRDRITILSVGRFVREKDYATAIRAVGKLHANGSGRSIRYFIVGYGPEIRSVERIIDEEGLSIIIKIVAHPPDIVSYYRQADIFLMTSLYEGMPNSLMEAMAYSLPVVSTDVGAVSNLVRDKINGFLCQAGDVDGICFALDQLTRSNDLRIGYGANGKKILSEKFSVAHLRNNYIDLIRHYSGFSPDASMMTSTKKP